MGLHATNLARAKVVEEDTSLQRHIKVWYSNQSLYMPNATILHLQKGADNSVEPTYKMKLYLPSEVGLKVDCEEILQEYEWEMHEAAANDHLKMLQLSLQLYSFLKGKQ